MNPDVELAAVFANTWYDTVKEGQIADALLEQGADVIATDLSAASALNASETAGRHSVGFQIDMSKHAPNGHLASVLLVWAPFLIDRIEKIKAGTWQPSKWGAFVGIDEGVLGLGGVPDDLPEEVREKVAAAKDAIIAGELEPFAGPLYAQDSSLIAPKGEVLSDQQLWQMHYFVQGIVVTMPKSDN